jgi:hypothetical protein
MPAFPPVITAVRPLMSPRFEQGPAITTPPYSSCGTISGLSGDAAPGRVSGVCGGGPPLLAWQSSDIVDTEHKGQDRAVTVSTDLHPAADDGDDAKTHGPLSGEPRTDLYLRARLQVQELGYIFDHWV